MKPALYVAGLAAAVAAGYFWGRHAGDAPGRVDTRPGYETARADRRVVELPADEVVALRERARRTRAAMNEVARLRERLREYEPEDVVVTEEDLPPGTRREDGTIVGGGRFSEQTRTMAVGFISGFLGNFMKEANLTEHQKQLVMKGFEERIEIALQISADFINGDATADQSYERLEEMATTGRALLAKTLDEQQMATYYKYENSITDFVSSNIVNNEMTRLRQKLDLDGEQERHVRRIVEQRYERVQEKFKAPLPNMFFQPMRREADKAIYDETAAEIRKYLRPEQVFGFDAIESDPNDPLYEYRSLLVPKTPPPPK